MAVLLVAFVLVQIFLPATATLPPRIFKQRSVISGFWQTLGIGSGNYIFSKNATSQALSLMTDLSRSLLPPGLVSIHQGRFCRGLRHPAAASDVVDGPWIRYRRNPKYEDRILLDERQHRIR